MINSVYFQNTVGQSTSMASLGFDAENIGRLFQIDYRKERRYTLVSRLLKLLGFYFLFHKGIFNNPEWLY